MNEVRTIIDILLKKEIPFSLSFQTQLNWDEGLDRLVLIEIDKEVKEEDLIDLAKIGFSFVDGKLKKLIYLRGEKDVKDDRREKEPL